LDIFDLINSNEKRLVAPLMGYPGVKYLKTTVKRSLLDPKLHFKVISALEKKFKPNIMFYLMDLTVEAEALGAKVELSDNHTPIIIEHPVKSEAALPLDRLSNFLECDRVVAFVETITKMKEGMSSLSGAYITGPFTLAGHLMGEERLCMNIHEKPRFVEKVLELCVETDITYMKELEKYADVICVLEPTAGIISQVDFKRFSYIYLKRIFNECRRIAALHICGDVNHIVDKMAETGAQILSLDADIVLRDAVKRVPSNVVLMGNIDPVDVMLDSTPIEVKKRVSELMGDMKGWRNFILSTGCDLPLDTPIENIAAFMEAARSIDPLNRTSSPL